MHKTAARENAKTNTLEVDDRDAIDCGSGSCSLVADSNQ